MSESQGTATVTVEILNGIVGDEDITVQFSTQDNTALRMFSCYHTCNVIRIATHSEEKTVKPYSFKFYSAHYNN